MKKSAKCISALVLVFLMSVAARAQKPEPTMSNVSYGPHGRNVMDIWLAESEEPTPLVVFIHGGGFSQGDKSLASEEYIKKCLDNGVSFAAINYPFYEDVALLEIIRDNIARAVQFLRYRSGEWNIDKNRVAVYGGSAGAGSSLWLAVHDDLADPDAEDPALRESTRVSAAGCLAVQATYDFPRWRKVFQGVIPEKTLAGWEMIMTDSVLKMYHVGSEEQMKSEEFESVRRELDMIGMMDADDSPVFLETFASQLKGGDLLHHPRHPVVVKERCDKKGMDCLLILDETPENERIDVIDFFLKYLK